MNLNEYQWSHNPRGMHGTGTNHQLWSEWKLGWLKMVSLGDENIQWGGYALEKGITPICRIYRSQMSGIPFDDSLRQSYQQYLQMGVKWFEFYNEPNLPYEWYDGVDLSPTNQDLIRPLCDNWLVWAEYIINGGGYPGFISLSELQTEWGNTTGWIISLLQYMFDNHYQRFLNVLNSGMWLSVHPYIVNHWYQEIPNGGALSARPPAQVNHLEGGWHFEYPYDPICQADDPGRTVWGGTPTAPVNDVVSLLGSGIAWLEKLQEVFGVGWIPAVGTEGGIWRVPNAMDPSFQPDNRYPPYDITSHGHGTLAMFNWLADQAPGWMFGLCLWEIETYMNHGNPIPAINMMGTTPTRMKNNIPNYPAIGSAPSPYDPNFVPSQQVAIQQPTQPPQPTQIPQPTVIVLPSPTRIPGPGPIHGTPTFHFIVFAPGFLTIWALSSPSLQAYITMFQPAIVSQLELIDFLTPDTSLAVTLLSTPDMKEASKDLILSRWGNVWIDAVSVAAQTELETVFERRVKNGVRFA